MNFSLRDIVSDVVYLELSDWLYLASRELEKLFLW